MTSASSTPSKTHGTVLLTMPDIYDPRTHSHDFPELALTAFVAATLCRTIESKGNKYWAPLLHNCAPSCLAMHFHRTLSVALAIIWSAVSVSCSYGKGSCTRPVVRKEWRAFCAEEKAEWIRAVNVRMRFSLALAVILRRCSAYSACPTSLMTRL